MWSIIKFGKRHKGKSLPEVILHDPDWFFWAIKDRVLENQVFAAEAHDLDFKARNIKIPRPDAEHWCVKYLFDYRDKFCGFTIRESVLGSRSTSKSFGFISCSPTRAI